MAVVLLKGTLLDGVVVWHRWRWCCSRELCLAVLWDSTDGGGAAQGTSAGRSCRLTQTLLGGLVDSNRLCLLTLLWERRRVSLCSAVSSIQTDSSWRSRLFTQTLLVDFIVGEAKSFTLLGGLVGWARRVYETYSKTFSMGGDPPTPLLTLSRHTKLLKLINISAVSPLADIVFRVKVG